MHIHSRRVPAHTAQILLAATAFPFLQAFAQSATSPTPPGLPPSPVRAVENTYFGTRVSDPYRYLEDLQNPQVQAWFKAQNDYARAVIAGIHGREALLRRIKQLDESSTPRVYDIHVVPGNRYFYQKRLPNEDVAKIYVRDGLNGPERLLVDPGKLAAPGQPSHVINYSATSQDGSRLLYGASPGGSEDAVTHIVDVATGRESSETIDRGWFASPSWLSDSRSFVYNRMQKMQPGMQPTERELKSLVYLHTVGTDPEKDRPVFGYGVSPQVTAAPTDIPWVYVVPGASYAIAVLAHGTQNELTAYVAPQSALSHGPIPWRLAFDTSDQVTAYTAHGDDLYLVSHKGASRYKVLHTTLSHPDVAHADVLVPASDAVVRDVNAGSDALYVNLLDGGIGRVLRLAFAARGIAPPEAVSLPLQGQLWTAAGDPRLPGLIFGLTSWTKAPAYYAYDARTRGLTNTGLQTLGPFDSPTDIVSEEVKVKSYDGTLIPLSIVHRRAIKLDGSNPTLLDGYGAYGITLDPFFDPKLLAWFEQGGVYAIAHVRGGGEYGEDWHLAGKMLTKHNTWRDFIAAGEYLIDRGYSSAGHLAGEGGSAGGITIGRAITDRPDLFAAAIDVVGISDALRAENSPNGPPNIAEFGSTTTEGGFKGLYEMSAYHHVKDGARYPAVMVVTGINDPRVAPWEPAKMAARLQAATSSGKPVLLRVDYEAGHGFGSTKTQQEDLLADEWSFLLWQFGVRDFQ
jgi:prolyl oligopeptidase